MVPLLAVGAATRFADFVQTRSPGCFQDAEDITPGFFGINHGCLK